MEEMHVAIVSLDPAMRLEAARAFDRAPSSWVVSLHRKPPQTADVVVLTPEVEGEGIRFDPDDPDRVVEEVRRAAAKPDGVIVVAAPSGGVGTTTVALHLGAVLARDADTCLVETAPGLRTRLRMPPDALSWADVAENGVPLDLAALPVAPGLRVVLAGDDAVPDLTAVSEAFGRVVVDAGWTALEEPLRHARCGVLVTAGSFAAMERAKAVLAAHPCRWAMVVNRVGPGGEATVAELESVLGHSIALELPCTPRLRDVEDEGRLLTGWSRWIGRIERLAEPLGTV